MSTHVSYYFDHIDALPFPELFADITRVYEPLLSLKSFLSAHLGDKQECHATIKGAAPAFYGSYYIGENTVIYDNVTIIGPVYIGKNVEIMPGATIRPGTIISDNCNIGHGSEVKNTLLFPGAKVASLAFVGDSILGKSARVGSGVITANRKFDQSNATLSLDGTRHDLGTDFFGAIVGDNSRIGANSVTQPGTHIGPNTWIFPLTNVRGFIPQEKRVFHDAPLCMSENEVIELKP